jgi:hypothetical protein
VLRHTQSGSPGSRDPGRVVVVRCGHAKYRDDGVAYELFYRPALRFDLGPSGAKPLLHDLPERLNVELSPEGGRPAHIGEDDVASSRSSKRASSPRGAPQAPQ